MSKIIFVSDNHTDRESVETFAKSNKYAVECYSSKDWEKQTWNVPSQPDEDNNEYLKPADNMIPFSPVNQSTVFNSMEDIKIEAIKKALIISNGNASKAAGMLKIGRATLYRKIKQLGFDLESLRKASAEQSSRRPVLKKSA